MNQPMMYVRIVRHNGSIPAWITTEIMTLDEAISFCKREASSGYDIEAIGADNERIYLAKGYTE